MYISIKVSFTDFMKNEEMYNERLNKKLDFTLIRITALKRVRELRELAKSRVDAFNKERWDTTLALTNKEKNEYLKPVNKFIDDK